MYVGSRGDRHPLDIPEAHCRLRPRLIWSTQATDADRARYQRLFQRALCACIPGMADEDAAKRWTLHAGRRGMQTNADELGLDRRLSRLLGGWVYDPQERSQDHYSHTADAVASLSAARGF